MSGSSHYKTTLMITPSIRPSRRTSSGTLSVCLEKNYLSKIESRPMKTGIGNYFFIIDLEMKLDEVLIPGAIAEMEALGCGVKCARKLSFVYG